LTGVHAGRVLSHEMGLVRGADAVPKAEGNTDLVANAMTREDLAGSKALCMHGTTLRENREVPQLLTADGAVCRIGKSEDAIR
jgi:hypothetical protein